MDAHDFLEKVISLLKDENVLDTTGEKTNKVINFKHPAELEKEIDFSLDGTEQYDSASLEQLCKQIIKYSVRTQHPHFYNQLYGGTDLFGLGGAWISEALNTNQHTFEAAPAFILAEQAVLRHVLLKFGYEQGDGIFAPGGSLLNLYGMLLARYKMFPDVKTKGMYGLPILVAFTSEDAHYSIQKAMHILGIGTENLVTIPSDEYGRMLPECLEKEVLRAKNDGKVPFFTNATAGTTVLGAIDPLNEIADICEEHGIWLHVDACIAGTLILSQKYRTRLHGIHRSDSIAWNAHKMLGAPLQCSLFLTKHNGLLHKCNSALATYLFQQDKFYDVSYDIGDKSIQCGRKTDAFKFWLMWKARGDLGFEKLVDNAMEAAMYFQQKISGNENFQLILEECDTSAVCFYYIPESMRGQAKNNDWFEKLNQVAPAIKEKMVKEGTLMIGYSPLQQKGLPNFFRMIITCHPAPTLAHMDFVVTEIERLGQNLQL